MSGLAEVGVVTEVRVVTEDARAHWVKGVTKAHKQIGLLLESSAGSIEVRMAAVRRESFEVASWKGREAGVAAGYTAPTPSQANSQIIEGFNLQLGLAGFENVFKRAFHGAYRSPRCQAVTKHPIPPGVAPLHHYENCI